MVSSISLCGTFGSVQCTLQFCLTVELLQFRPAMVLNFKGFIWKFKMIITNKLAQPKHSQSRPATDMNGTKTRVYNFVFFELRFSFSILF